VRALPAYQPPALGWNRLQARMQARRRRYAAAGGGLALAASLLVAVGMVGLKPEVAPPADTTVRATAVQAPAVAQLISRSQNLEQQLAYARPQTVVWNSRRDTRAALLEQRLRMVDTQLNYADSDSAERLWRDRVKLMNALVELHQPEEPALHYASYQY
jgi:hypothetical protein